MTIPQFYIDNKIPKVRWMEVGKAYKARLITLPRCMDKAKMFVYVINDSHLIAYQDEVMTDEVGMFKVEHFELFGHLNRVDPPHYESLYPTSIAPQLEVECEQQVMNI